MLMLTLGDYKTGQKGRRPRWRRHERHYKGNYKRPKGRRHREGKPFCWPAAMLWRKLNEKFQADWKDSFKKKQVGVSDMTLLSTISNDAINDNLKKR